MDTPTNLLPSRTPSDHPAPLKKTWRDWVQGAKGALFGPVAVVTVLIAMLGGLYAQLGATRELTASHATHLAGLEKRMDGVESKLDGLTERAGKVEERLARLEETVKGQGDLLREVRDGQKEQLALLQRVLLEKRPR